MLQTGEARNFPTSEYDTGAILEFANLNALVEELRLQAQKLTKAHQHSRSEHSDADTVLTTGFTCAPCCNVSANIMCRKI